jgi:orotate phosphoribosyltransferase
MPTEALDRRHQQPEAEEPHSRTIAQGEAAQPDGMWLPYSGSGPMPDSTISPLPDDDAARTQASSLLAVVREHGWTRREEPFRLSSGAMSHDYVDLRRAVATGAALAVAARAVIDLLAARRVAYDAIGGMTMGADPVAHAVALLSGSSWFSVRKEAKEHGQGRRVEGAPIGNGWYVVLFEDTVTTGGSMLKAFDVVRATGAEVVLACTLLDRGDVTAARFADLAVPYQPLLTYRDLGIEPVVPDGAPA